MPGIIQNARAIGLLAWLLVPVAQADVTAEMQRGAPVDNPPAESQAAANSPVNSTNQESTPVDIGRMFPGAPMTGGYLKTQKLFDAFYTSQRYQEAHKVLFKGLVWRGDKYAQYMLGIMYWHGQGVVPDKVKGAAWFRLSAQRGNTKLMKLRDEAWMQLTPEQKTQATAHFEEIRDEFGDRKVIKMLLRRDNWHFSKSLASHATARGGNLVIVDGSGTTTRGFEYADARDARIQIRLDYLGGYVEYGELDLIDDASTASNQGNEE